MGMEEKKIVIRANFFINRIVGKQLRSLNTKVNKKNQPVINNLVLMCPEQDSNLHTVAGTSPSSWRVYQFHHLGGLAQGSVPRAQGKKYSGEFYPALCALRSALFLCPEQDSNLHIIADTSP